MLINPSRECCLYADVGMKGRLEIRKVRDELQPVLCGVGGEELITSHNLPNLRNSNDLAQVISKLTVGYVRVVYSLDKWHLFYQSQPQVRGFYPLLIPPQHTPPAESPEATKEDEGLSASNNPVGSNLHSGNQPHSSSHSHESSTMLVEEGGASADNILSFINTGNIDPRPNFEVNSAPSTISADRVALLSSQELSHSASTAAWVVDKGAATPEAPLSDVSPGAILSFSQAVEPIIQRVFESYISRLESALKDTRTEVSQDMDQKLSSLRDEMSLMVKEAKKEITRQISKESADFESRSRREGTKERASGKIGFSGRGVC